jgi:CTP:molybdopterin cytidylyltransferase MocA
MVMGRDMIEAFLRAPAESTAKEVRAERQDRVRYIEVNDENVVRNVNTPEEYAQASQALTGGPA